jgi:hypothetical protein
MLLRLAKESQVEQVDWDRVSFRSQNGSRTVKLPNPMRLTREEGLSAFRDHDSLEEILDALGAVEERQATVATGAYGQVVSGWPNYWRNSGYDSLS